MDQYINYLKNISAEINHEVEMKIDRETLKTKLMGKYKKNIKKVDELLENYEILNNKITNDNNIYFICQNCNSSFEIEPGTIILSTNFDEKLELLLQPALLAYEMDRSLGISIGNEDFQNSIKRFVQKGYSFRAYPTCFSHANVPSIASTIRQAAACKQVIYVHSSSASAATKLGVRVKIFTFPEGIMALWIMIAAVYE
jgi:transposase-like protein